GECGDDAGDQQHGWSDPGTQVVSSVLIFGRCLEWRELQASMTRHFVRLHCPAALPSGSWRASARGRLGVRGTCGRIPARYGAMRDLDRGGPTPRREIQRSRLWTAHRELRLSFSDRKTRKPRCTGWKLRWRAK